MPLTRSIPELAMPVVEAIQKDVPKPKVLPEIIKMVRAATVRPAFVLRFPARLGVEYGCCPMGLHPQAKTDTPSTSTTFPVLGVLTSAVIEFGHWWDEQTDAEAAVAAVWGE